MEDNVEVKTDLICRYFNPTNYIWCYS